MRRSSFALAAALSAALVALSFPAASAKTASTAWHPKATGLLDCNGYSPVQRVAKHLQCAEIAANEDDGFEDNGHYVGHDEADIGWFSSQPGSSTKARWDVTLPTDPPGAPSTSFSGPVADFQLTVAPWFGMVLCDNQSYPEGNPNCTTTDANIQVPPRPDHAGAAFVELQLYPPGYPPFIQKVSCDFKHWCAAVAIFSLQAQYGALHGPGSPPNAVANPNCVEPANFAFLTLSGNPVAPPGPDTATPATFVPNKDTLLMNQGDKLSVTLRDTPAGLLSQITDRTTGQTGKMVASQANGFRHILWDPVNFTCQGAPYAFHPMYSSAAPPTASGQPTAWTTWSAHTDNLSFSNEIGHFESKDGDSDDANCFGGPRIPGCLMFGIGDSDFDGYSYHADWPNGSPNFPTPMYLSSPRTGGGFTSTYNTARFETDLPRIEEPNSGGVCDHHTGTGCTNPPPGAQFYPWYHLANAGGGCAWAMSNDLPNQISNFGGEQAAWGPLELTDYGFDQRYHNFANTISNPCP
jgi:hypothetical protein